jgi:hypothetical protein
MLNCSQKDLENQAGLGTTSENASQVIIPSYTPMQRGLVNDAQLGSAISALPFMLRYPGMQQQLLLF